MQMIISQLNQQPIRAYMLSYHGKKTTCMYETTLYMPQVLGQPLTHHPMQVPTGNQYRVSPDSHLTTRSLCDIYLIVSCLFGQQNFSGSHRGSLTPSDIFRAFTGGYVVKPGFQVFHPRGVSIPYLLRPTHFIFHFRLTLWNSIGLRPIPKPTRFNTKCSAKSVPCTHSHVMWCYRTPMQCNLCHCTQTHDQCMKTSTWTFYTIHYVCAMNTHI